MSLFRRNHKTEVIEIAGSGWYFRCSCGAQSRASRTKEETEMKASLHKTYNS
jgi:hypothetical protein